MLVGLYIGSERSGLWNGEMAVKALCLFENSPIVRARLIVLATLRWCVAQLPLYVRGMISPKPVRKVISSGTF